MEWRPAACPAILAPSAVLLFILFTALLAGQDMFHYRTGPRLFLIFLSQV